MSRVPLVHPFRNEPLDQCLRVRGREITACICLRLLRSDGLTELCLRVCEMLLQGRQLCHVSRGLRLSSYAASVGLAPGRLELFQCHRGLRPGSFRGRLCVT